MMLMAAMGHRTRLEEPTVGIQVIYTLLTIMIEETGAPPEGTLDRNIGKIGAPWMRLTVSMVELVKEGG